MLKKIMMLTFFSLSIQSCSGEGLFKPNNDSNNELVWVFAQFNVPEEGEKIDSFWYYGRISESLYDNLSNNSIEKGFVFLQDVHYWSNEVLHDYKDDEETGEMLFRIDDLQRLRRINKLPVNKEENAEIIQEL